jgi:hypothetical protein
MLSLTKLHLCYRSGKLARRVLLLALFLFILSQFLPQSEDLYVGWFFRGSLHYLDLAMKGAFVWGPYSWKIVGMMCAQILVLLIFTLTPWMVDRLGRARVLAWVAGVLMVMFAADMARFAFGVKVPGTSETFRLVYSWGSWTMIAAMAMNALGLFLIPKARGEVA